MNELPVLCVGGRCDGTRVKVPTENHFVLPVPNSVELTDNAAVGEFQNEHYFIERIVESKSRTAILIARPSGQTLYQTLALLVDGYRKP